MKRPSWVLAAMIMGAILAGCNATAPDRQVSQRSYVEDEHCVTLEERKALAAFIVDCSRAANPMSDEEGEDLVAQCERTGERALCPRHQHVMEWDGFQWNTREAVSVPATAQATTTQEK